MLDKTHPRRDNPKSSQLGHGNYEDVVGTLERAVSNGFLLGNHFTAADLYLASNLEWYIFTKALDAKPIFSEYIKMCQNRPGYKRFIDQVGSFK